MAKVKTNEDSYACSCLGEFTNWDFNSRYGYSFGMCTTKSGIISLYYQPKSKEFGNTETYATARIVHNKRIYNLRTNDKVTRLGWTRIVKKWARNIWSG